MQAPAGGPPMMPASSSSTPSSKVELSVSCTDLADMDLMSKSDPMCVLFSKPMGSTSYREVERTEQVMNTLNPIFVKKFVMTYFFEESQKLKFELYDVDSKSRHLDSQDFLGRCEVTLGQIVGAPNSTYSTTLTRTDGKRGKGHIKIKAEELLECKQALSLHLSGAHLDKKDFFGKSDPFLIFHRTNEDRSWTAVHKTEVIKNTLNPTWRPIQVPLTKLCNGDVHRTLLVECFDWDSDGSHDLIGSFQTCVFDLTDTSSTRRAFELINPKKKAKKKSYKNSGVIHVNVATLVTEHTFLDYIKTGSTQMNCVIAIDFTGSNGNPSRPDSLHYINPYEPTQYARAISSVGGILQDYDADKQFPVLGFGAKFPDGTVSHEFFVNGNPSSPFVQGIDGVYTAYYECLKRVQLWGPTNFSPIINHVARLARQAGTGGETYYVLLMLTDGVISDFDSTIASIISASSLPISIIIVGVGNAEFDAMDALDADDRLLSNGRHTAERDIVQFVPFRDFIGGRAGNNMQMSQDLLAKEVLAEIPGQFMSYMKKHGIQPRQAPPSQGDAPPPPYPA